MKIIGFFLLTFSFALAFAQAEEEPSLEVIKNCGKSACKKRPPAIVVEKNDALNIDRLYDTGQEASGCIGSNGCSSLYRWVESMCPEESDPTCENPVEPIALKKEETCSGAGCSHGIIPISDVIMDYTPGCSGGSGCRVVADPRQRRR